MDSGLSIKHRLGTKCGLRTGVRQTQTADWQINIVLKCSNPNPNTNLKRLVLGLIRVSDRVRVRAL